jgi:hypothetical protein
VLLLLGIALFAINHFLSRGDRVGAAG